MRSKRAWRMFVPGTGGFTFPRKFCFCRTAGWPGEWVAVGRTILPSSARYARIRANCKTSSEEQGGREMPALPAAPSYFRGAASRQVARAARSRFSLRFTKLKQGKRAACATPDALWRALRAGKSH